MASEEPDDGTTRPEARRAATDRARAAILTVFGPGAVDSALLAARVLTLSRRLTIGRGRAPEAPDGELRLRDPLLSRVHARLAADPGGAWRVEDAGSLNGTLLGARRITDACLLSDGDVLLFGSWAAVFRRASPQGVAALDEDRASPFAPGATLSPALAETLSRVRRLVRARADIFLVGETGVGKEVYARAIHRASGRTGRFVAINCAAVPSELAESELFGYARGAHSLATEAKQGLLQTAHGGTLFLDEVGDMSPRLQGKLLRALQEREVMPLGATKPHPVDVIVVAATSRPLQAAGQGTLREDLAARLGAEPIQIPPLRERIEDLAHLVPWFLAGTPIRRLEMGALRALCLYHWPRNVRELEKALHQAAALAPADELRLEDLPRAVRGVLEPASPVDRVETPRARAKPSPSELEDLLRQHRGNVAEVARRLDRRGHVVWRWIAQHRLEPDRYRQ
jgi:DNA-binding NtrC family response regulator